MSGDAYEHRVRKPQEIGGHRRMVLVQVLHGFVWNTSTVTILDRPLLDLQGKRRNRSTRVAAQEKKRKEAQKIAEAYEEAANKRRTSRQVRRSLPISTRKSPATIFPRIPLGIFRPRGWSAKRPR